MKQTPKTTVSLKAKGESFGCLLPYLFTPSAHHLTQPLHLSKSAPSIYLTTHLSIYRSIHLPALITPHRLLFLFRTALSHSLFFHLALHSTVPLIHFLTLQIHLLYSFTCAKLANLAMESRADSRLLFHLALQTPWQTRELGEVLCFSGVRLKIEQCGRLITNRRGNRSWFDFSSAKKVGQPRAEPVSKTNDLMKMGND